MNEKLAAINAAWATGWRKSAVSTRNTANMPPLFPSFASNTAVTPSGGKPLFQEFSRPSAGGERVCLVGANGSGKSTIPKALAGRSDLDQGRSVLSAGHPHRLPAPEPDLNATGNVGTTRPAGLPGIDPDDYLARSGCPIISASMAPRRSDVASRRRGAAGGLGADAGG